MTIPMHKTRWIMWLMLLSAMPAPAAISWGVRAGIARSSLVQEIDLDYWSGSRLGYSVAALADIPFYNRFSFRPEIALACEGGSFHSEPSENIFLQRHGLRSYSLQPSFNVAFNIPIAGVQMAVYGGPALDFLLCSKITTERAGGELSGAAGKELKSFDVGVNAGISVEYKGVFFSITALPGTIYRQKMKAEDEPPVFQNNLTFSLGYIFR